MHDAFLTHPPSAAPQSVFADPRMAEILIRHHAPEWATEIDFSTFREESTGLVSKKTHQRRQPDMIWSADTVNGERVLFLLEFQRTVERLMALRTTTYAALTLEGIAAGRWRESPPDQTSVLEIRSRSSSISSSTTATDPGRLRPAWPTCSRVPIRDGTVWSHGVTQATTGRATISRRWSSAWPATFRRRICPCSYRPCGMLSIRTELRAWMDSWSRWWPPC